MGSNGFDFCSDFHRTVAPTVQSLISIRYGDIWVWDAALATHAQAAKSLQIPYSNPPGGGEVLINEEHVG